MTDKFIKIEFEVMGLDSTASNFLNWCMENRDNLEFIKDSNALRRKSQSAILHFDDLCAIQRIDNTYSHKRFTCG
jgi:hypothetical protein